MKEDRDSQDHKGEKLSYLENRACYLGDGASQDNEDVKLSYLGDCGFKVGLDEQSSTDLDHNNLTGSFFTTRIRSFSKFILIQSHSKVIVS